MAERMAADKRRTLKAKAIVSRGGVEPLGDGRYAVAGDSGKPYIVDPEARVPCRCGDSDKGGNLCKHRRAVGIYEARKNRERAEVESRAWVEAALDRKREVANDRARARWGESAVIA